MKKKLEAVEYSTRFAVGLYYDKGTVLNPPYISYVNNDPIFRYYAVDNMKRNRRKLP
jgi:renalase